MSQISMYVASVPVLTRALRNLSAVLSKGEAHAAARNLDQAVLLGYRLAPDMFPLTRQVQIAADMAKGCAARLAGVEVPSYADDEKSFADLQARLDKTIAFIESFQPAQIDGSEGRSVTLKMRSGERSFQGLPYLLDFVLPNVYFHSTAAYSILRHCGVELGKADFLGA
jgi:hypothetical protein